MAQVGVAMALMLGLASFPTIANAESSLAQPTPSSPEAQDRTGGFNAETSRRDDRLSSAKSTVYTNADGTKTVHTFSRPVNYRDGNGSWRPIDTTLVRQTDGSLVVKANAVRASFAAKVSQTATPMASRRAAAVAPSGPKLANLELPGGKSVGYWLSGAAPATPTVDGSKATYSNLLPHTDLELEAFDSGIKETLVLRSPDAPSSWSFPLALSGLTPRMGDDGRIDLVDSTGAVAAWFPRGYMQDSKIDPQSGDSAQSTGVTYRLDTQGGLPVLRVEADSAWLRDPARVFPVRVDPTTMTGTTGDVYVDNDNSTGDHNGDNLPVGTYEGGKVKARSFIHLDDFDNAGLIGKRITKAQLKLYLTWAYSCTVDKPFDVRAVNQKWSVAGLTSSAWPGPSISEPIGTLTVTDPGKACTNRSGDRNVGKWVTVPLKVNAFNKWSGGDTNNGLALTASETTSTAWKRFTSANFRSGMYKPALEITYVDNAPPQITERSPADNAVVRTLTPELTARGKDPDSFPNKGLTYTYTVTSADGKSTVTTSGAAGSTWTVPAGKLSWNTSYRYTVRANDKVGNGPPSPAFTFRTSNTEANLPILVSRGIGIANDGKADATCVTGTSRPTVNTETPRLWATFKHANHATVNADFEFADLDGVVLGSEHVDAVPISGPVEAWVPQDTLAAGGSYRWRVRVRTSDGTQAGAYSSWCEFTVRPVVAREALSTTPDTYTELTDLDPNGADTGETAPPGDEPLPGIDDQPPYVPTPDDGSVAEESDVDEAEFTDPEDELEGTVRQFADVSDPDPARDVTVQGALPDPASQKCPFSGTEAALADGAATSAPDGKYSCSFPTSDPPPAETEAEALEGGSVDAEETDDTAAAEVQMMKAAAARTPVGGLGDTPLSDECRRAPLNKWQVGRYDACHREHRTWVFVTVINGRTKWDGQLFYTVYRYARQSSTKGTWDYHVYLHVDTYSGNVSGARAHSVYLWCNDGRCSTRLRSSSGSLSRVGNWVQFSGTITSPVQLGKRITNYAKLSFRIARPGDVGVTPEVVSSNWVRCDRALKGSKSTGCVVPNFIPSLRYSRKGRYPDLANHIYAAQQSGLAGRPGGALDGQPGSDRKLTRLNDANLRKKNGSRACRSGFRAKVGAPKSTTCDEYPFRSTYQGAYTVDPERNLPRTFSFCHLPRNKKTGRHGYSHCFINGKQNEAGGRWVGRFYGTGGGGMRLLDGDGFYVRIS